MSRKRIHDMIVKQESSNPKKILHIFAEPNLSDASEVCCFKAKNSHLVVLDDATIPRERIASLRASQKEKYAEKEHNVTGIADRYVNQANRLATSIIKCFFVHDGKISVKLEKRYLVAVIRTKAMYSEEVKLFCSAEPKVRAEFKAEDDFIKLTFKIPVEGMVSTDSPDDDDNVI